MGAIEVREFILRILVSGASGLVGTALSAFLRNKGHEVHALVRHKPDPAKKEVGWDPFAGVLDASRLDGFDSVVHLAGESLASRWTDVKKKAILDSRVRGTRMLSEVVSLLPQKPKVFVSASAVGFYGARGDEVLDESSSPGTGFLPDVCRQWEDAASYARDAGISTVSLRTGIILSSKGGALARMLTPFKWGAGGVVGSGKQWMSWISLTDEAAAIHHALTTDLSGPVNLTAPNPVTNGEFTKTLGKVLGRPAVFPLPGFVVKLLFGEMGDELLLKGQKVLPKKLTVSGFRFFHPDLESALRFELGD